MHYLQEQMVIDVIVPAYLEWLVILPTADPNVCSIKIVQLTNPASLKNVLTPALAYVEWMQFAESEIIFPFVCATKDLPETPSYSVKGLQVSQGSRKNQFYFVQLIKLIIRLVISEWLT